MNYFIELQFWLLLKIIKENEKNREIAENPKIVSILEIGVSLQLVVAVLLCFRLEVNRSN